MPPHSPSPPAGPSSNKRKRSAPPGTTLFNFFAARSGPAPAAVAPASSPSPTKGKSREDAEFEWAIQQSLRDHEEHQKRSRQDQEAHVPDVAAIVDMKPEPHAEIKIEDDDDDANLDSHDLPPPEMPPCLPLPDTGASEANQAAAAGGRNAFSLLMSNSNAAASTSALPAQPLSTLPTAGSSACDSDPLLTPSSLIKFWTQCDQIEGRNRLKRGTRKPREVPFYKVLLGMPLAVDAFRFGNINGCVGHFLSHAHSDHYAGLSPSWNSGPVYCSPTTANLIQSSLGVREEWVKPLPYDEEFVIPDSGGVTVTLLPANHCPGSCVFLFEGPRTAYILPKPASSLGIPSPGPLPHVDPKTGEGKRWRYLHCGDFRASPALLNHPSVRGQPLDIIYLDTTYLNPRYCFPAQEEVVRECAQCAWDNLPSRAEKERADEQRRQWERAGWNIEEESGWRGEKGKREDAAEKNRRKYEVERKGMRGWLGKGDPDGGSEGADAKPGEEGDEEAEPDPDGDADEEAAWRDAHARMTKVEGYEDGDQDEDELRGEDELDFDGDDRMIDEENGPETNDGENTASLEDALNEAGDPDVKPSKLELVKQEPQTPSPPPPSITNAGKKAAFTSPGVVGSRVLQVLEAMEVNRGDDNKEDNKVDGVPFWKRVEQQRLNDGSSDYINLEEIGVAVPAGQSRLPFAKAKDESQNDNDVKKEMSDAGVNSIDNQAQTNVMASYKSPAGAPTPGKLLIVVGTYSIGKEKIALSCALRLGTRIFCASPSKYRIFSQLEDEPLLQGLLTQDPTKAMVHVTSLFNVNYEGLRAHIDALKKVWGINIGRCIAFRPTGWSYRPPNGIDLTGADLSKLVETNLARPRYDWKTSFRPTRDSTQKIQMYGVPYSEHSSFFELTCFALSTAWERIVPTVNVGNKRSRAKMEGWIKAWKRERERRERLGLGAVTGRSKEYF